ISASECEGEKSHRGFAGQNLILHRGIEWSKSTLALGLPEWSGKTASGPVVAANNAPSNVSCNSTTGICVPAKMIPPPGYSPVKNAVKWYLCGNGPFDNIKNYTLEGLGKGALVGGFLGSEFGPAGTFLGATGGAVEGFFSGDAVGWVAAAGCQAAGMYGPAS